MPLLKAFDNIIPEVLAFGVQDSFRLECGILDGVQKELEVARYIPNPRGVLSLLP